MRVKGITSESNTTFKTFLKLTRGQGIRKHGIALLSGPKQVREVLRDFPGRCKGIIFSDRQEPPPECLNMDIPLYCLGSDLFCRIDLYNTGHPVLVVRTTPFTRFIDESWPSGCTLCIPFQDPANVGAAIRSAAAFGASRVVILKEAAHPFLPKSVQVAGSNIFRVPLFEGMSLQQLKVSKVPVITLSPRGKDVREHLFPSSFCLVPGLEGPGLPDHLKDSTCLSIPMEPGIESINAALATGIVMYLWRSRLRERQRTDKALIADALV